MKAGVFKERDVASEEARDRLVRRLADAVGRERDALIDEAKKLGAMALVGDPWRRLGGARGTLG